MDAGAQTEIDSRLDHVPAMDDQHQHVAMTIDQLLDLAGDPRKNPGRLMRDVFNAIAVQGIAIHPGVDQRMGLQAP